ncbi:MAG: hypothetical protein ABIF28_09555 [Pseudomonadota bacterium]
MGKPYQQELDLLPATFQWAGRQDVSNLARFLTRWKGEHVAIVGSGGSFSAAVIGALFRELSHHCVTTPVTPHEFTGVSHRLMPRILLISAEGKNKDILLAARAAEAADLAVAALTLTASNPLIALAQRTKAVRVFAFQMDWIKDGYLATNSLLATVLLLYRSFFSERDYQGLAALMSPERLGARRLELQACGDLVELRQRGMLLLFSAQAKPFAVDLESKLSEAALVAVQMCDLRQFAHGRHLQLADPDNAPLVFLACSAAERSLAIATLQLIPATSRPRLIEIEGSSEHDIAVSGLVDAMYVTEALARKAGRDPGNPQVAHFGRALHDLDPAESSNEQDEGICLITAAARRKSGALSRIPPPAHVLVAARDYANRLYRARFKGVICDFDGTLCRTENRFDGIDAQLVGELSALLRQGLKLAIATGRGGSLYDHLRVAFEPDLHASILVGYYSGAYLATLDQPFAQPDANEEFGAMWDWLKQSSYDLPEMTWREITRGGHLSLRLANVHKCESLLASIQVWMEQTGRKGWRAFCSGHSVDVLDSATSKGNVVKRFVAAHGLDAATEILRIGDCGQEGGNDYELLSEGLSLSCDRVSASLITCWNYGALGNNQSEVTMSYLKALTAVEGAFRLSPSALPFLETAVIPAGT